jgi:hypothetical protein
MTGLSSASSNSRKIEDAECEQSSGHDLSRAECLLTWTAKRITAFLRFARHAYLLRVPFVIAALLLALPFAALLQKSPLRVLLQNLFLLDGGSGMWPWPTFWSTRAALVLSWSILLTTRIVRLNCKDRFNLPSVMTAADLRGWPFLPSLFSPCRQSLDSSRNRVTSVPLADSARSVSSPLSPALCVPISLPLWRSGWRCYWRHLAHRLGAHQPE